MVKRLQYLAGLINEEEDDFGSIDNPLDKPASKVERFSGLVKQLNNSKSEIYNYQNQFTFSPLYDNYPFSYIYKKIFEVDRKRAIVEFVVYINDSKDQDLICYSLKLASGHGRSQTIINECQPLDNRGNLTLKKAIEDRSVDYYNRFKTGLLNNNSYVLKAVEELNLDLDSFKNAVKQ